MRCMISGKEFDDSKEFPAKRTADGKMTDAHETAQRAHAEEQSKWHHVQVLVDGKETLAGHIAPDVNPESLTLVSKGAK